MKESDDVWLRNHFYIRKTLEDTTAVKEEESEKPKAAGEAVSP